MKTIIFTLTIMAIPGYATMRCEEGQGLVRVLSSIEPFAVGGRRHTPPSGFAYVDDVEQEVVK